MFDKLAFIKVVWVFFLFFLPWIHFYELTTAHLSEHLTVSLRTVGVGMFMKGGDVFFIFIFLLHYQMQALHM